MSQRSMQALFNPSSIAVIGASANPERAGNLVMKNLLAGGFSGPIMPVSPKYTAVMGVLAYPSIMMLPIKPDLAIICTRASRVPELVETLAQFGCKTAIIMASGMAQESDETGQNLLHLALAHAKRYGMRLLGPNSLGMLFPNIGLNASLTHTNAKLGKIAFLSQSSAICTTVLDWANNKGIGFSAIISLGDAADVDFDELLDYLGKDSQTSAIILYLDAINEKRHFLSAARAASRNKPILVLKSGRSIEGMQAAKLHTGGTQGNDAVYDAAFRRAGMLRVHSLVALFAAVESLAHSIQLKGERLAIISNGGGPAILAADELIIKGGKLAQLSAATTAALSAVLPRAWSGQNPIDLVGDANGQRYCQALAVVFNSGDADAILILHSPSASQDSLTIAQEIHDCINTLPAHKGINILTNWAGEDSAYPARKFLNRAGIATYRTPEGAVNAFMQMVEYRRNQKLLQEVPVSISKLIPKDTVKARHLLNLARARGQYQLATHETGEILAAYGLNTIDTDFALDTKGALKIAKQLGYPVALKLKSNDIMYKSDVHCVMLNLQTEAELIQAAQQMLIRVNQTLPNAHIEGLIIQKMALTAGAQELRLAVIHDEVFGPALCLGEGGSEWDPTRDAAVALPPLNMALARYMLIQALKTNKIKDRHLPAGLDLDAICVILTKISQLVIDCPEIKSLDINPLLASGDNICCLDVSMELNPQETEPLNRLAIMPYPVELEETTALNNGMNIMIRPILPEDEPQHLVFDNALSAEDRYLRYFGARSAMTHEEMAVLTQIDYAREMAFIATYDKDGETITLGAVRASIDPDNTEAEFAMAVRSDYQGLGLGKLLLQKIIGYYQQQGTERLTGYTMFTNQNMARLAKSLGFIVSFDMEEQLIKMEMPLAKSFQ
ncbi:GCN5-related N-acetyltransferase [Shewanella denitrificans OS217]|jgi:acetyltransferase|uniref:GCN5-related N-acetyltransferase n=1 Tax=Shewanella denitrificans (strain OS217 / ATCC BAA-1090 / DSM 15013) TaxID=318161 RepID=Q12N16_SHEDO|nr:acetate--CoA ligase family protein [Shewanella denitrificans]ABE55160.1 GCN5-related N-acetyltransferase [Shewanella denitrificans OS217]